MNSGHTIRPSTDRRATVGRPGRCVASGLLMAAGFAIVLGGCQERRMIITSEPADALVHLNDVEVGRTPCEVDFTYFGVYDVRLSKPGYEPLATQAEAKAPLHEWPGFDLVAMAVPVRKKTLIEWHFVLEPELVDRDGLMQRAREMQGSIDGPDQAPPPAQTP